MSYLGNKMKSIISICAIVLTISVISLLGYTMSTDGSSTIYTRDELSERITQLEQENALLLDKGKMIRIISQSSYHFPADVVTTIDNTSVFNTNYDKTIYKYENNTVTIMRNGLYRITLYCDVALASQPSRVQYYATRNGSDWMGTGAYSDTFVNSVGGERVGYERFSYGEIIGMSILPLSSVTTGQFLTLTLEYLGE